MNILIIEDNPADSLYYRKQIEESKIFSNVNITECRNLTQAFVTLSENKLDVILLDLGLPESEGIQTVTSVVEELQKKEIQIPIIVLTGLDDHVVGKEAYKRGVKDFLLKTKVEKNNRELTRAINFATYHLNFQK